MSTIGQVLPDVSPCTDKLRERDSDSYADVINGSSLRADKDNDEVRINLMRILKNKCDLKHNLNVLRENRGMLRDHS